MTGGRGRPATCSGWGAISVGCGTRTASGGMDRTGGGGGGDTGRTGGPEVGLTDPGGTDTGCGAPFVGGWLRTGGGGPGAAGEKHGVGRRGTGGPVGVGGPPPAPPSPRLAAHRRP